MSLENYKLFTDFYNKTVENATDDEMHVIFGALSLAFKNMDRILAENGRGRKNKKPEKEK